MDLSKNYIVIQGWMRSKLKLSGVELMIYAIIYGFSQIENQKFTGSLAYLTERTGCTKRHLQRILPDLCNRNLICKHEKFTNGVKFVEYYINKDVLNVMGIDKMSTGGDDIMSANNIELYTIESTSISNDIDVISSPQDLSTIKQTDITPKENTPLPGPLPVEVKDFLNDSYQRFPSIKYQVDKGKDKYFLTTMKDFEKLCKEYGTDTLYTVLNFIKQDEFRSKQIQSISKLRKKNKDGVPYMVVMLEKIQNYKPKIIDLDNLK